jgi:hypothetical protein
VSEQKKPGPGKGPTNLSGARGASPVLRVRMPAELLKAADAKAMQTGESLPAVVRELLRQWVRPAMDDAKNDYFDEPDYY